MSTRVRAPEDAASNPGVASSAIPGTRLGAFRRASTTRARLLGWYLALVLLALVVGLVVQRSLLLAQVDREVDAQLRQEVEELLQLSGGWDPRTGEPFAGNIEAIFDTFLSRTVPAEGEALFTLVGGAPYASTRAPLQLLADPALVERWSTVTEPEQGEVPTDAGRVRYLAVPVVYQSETVGVFVVAMFMQTRLEAVGSVIRTGIVVYGAVVAFASVLAWFAAGRVLRPVGLLTDAARAVSESNWTERIPVEGDDQIAFLARTFNEMLDRLEAAFASQRRLIDDAGHELRTPITVIRGHLELLPDDPDEREASLRLVLDELDRMGRMVDDLLLLARAEQRDFLHLHPVDVDALTDDIAVKARMLGDRGWTVEERASVVAIADEQRLTQAAMNLCRNALEHTEPGTRVTIGSRARDGWLYLWVDDDGPGIPAEEQARIFDRFARGTRADRDGDGAGLGLAITQAIAEAHGGYVALDSRPGEGSRFTLVVPIEPEPDTGEGAQVIDGHGNLDAWEEYEDAWRAS